MGDNQTGQIVKTRDDEFVRSVLVDSGGTNEAAISAAGRISVDASGIAVPITDNAGSITVDGSVSLTGSLPAGTNNIGDVDVLSVPAPLSTAGNGTAATALRVTLASDGTGVVTLTGSLPAGTNNIGDVDVLSIVPGTAATNLGKAIDSAPGATDTGVAALVVRDDALATLTPADGDYTTLRVNDSGALWVVSTGGPSGTEYTEGATDASITGTAILWEDSGDTLRSVSAATPLPIVQIGATPAGTNNIGDVDVLTVPAPLSTTGNGTAATALRVTMASDSTGVVTLTGSLPAGTNNIGDVDVLTVPADPFGVNADAASATGSISAKLRFIAATGIPITALPASTNTIEVVGDAAADAAAAGNPLYIGGRASAAAPTDVSADGDVVPAWHLRNGAQATVITAAGALVGGDATNGLDVDVTRVQGTVASNITQVGGATIGATAYLPTRLTDGTAYYANTGQTAGAAHFSRITDATNTAAVIATINALKTDFSSVAGAVPSATNPVPVRLTDGTAFYSALAAAGGAPEDPQMDTESSTDVGAGSAVDLDFTAITTATTGELMGIDVSAAVPVKVEVKTVNAGTPTTRAVYFFMAGESMVIRPPHKAFITQAGGATSRFRATVTNMDQSEASNIYATAFWDEAA